MLFTLVSVTVIIGSHSLYTYITTTKTTEGKKRNKNNKSKKNKPKSNATKHENKI